MNKHTSASAAPGVCDSGGEGRGGAGILYEVMVGWAGARRG